MPYFTKGISGCRGQWLLGIEPRRLIEAIPEAGWTPIEYWLAGGADVAETTYTPFKGEQDAASVRLIVRRVKPTPGSQLALFTRYSYHAFITTALKGSKVPCPTIRPPGSGW